VCFWNKFLLFREENLLDFHLKELCNREGQRQAGVVLFGFDGVDGLA